MYASTRKTCASARHVISASYISFYVCTIKSLCKVFRVTYDFLQIEFVFIHSFGHITIGRRFHALHVVYPIALFPLPEPRRDDQYFPYPFVEGRAGCFANACEFLPIHSSVPIGCDIALHVANKTRKCFRGVLMLHKRRYFDRVGVYVGVLFLDGCYQLSAEAIR